MVISPPPGIPAPLYFGLPPVPDDALYVHHPALLAAMMLVDHRMLGDGEWAARCLPILFSLATAAMLALFCRRMSGLANRSVQAWPSL